MNTLYLVALTETQFNVLTLACMLGVLHIFVASFSAVGRIIKRVYRATQPKKRKKKKPGKK